MSDKTNYRCRITSGDVLYWSREPRGPSRVATTSYPTGDCRTKKKESYDAYEGNIQEVIGEGHCATGLECQVIICTTRWLPRAAIEAKLLGSGGG